MTKLKVLSKAYLLLACLLCFSAYKSHASNYSPGVGADTEGVVSIIAPPAPIEQPPTLIAPNPVDDVETVVTPPPQYSNNNPFRNSQYTDLANVAEQLLDLGISIDDYFYSEGFTTGIDGELGNEYVCIRDDANRVYIGRSDVCSNVASNGYDYIHIDQIDISDFGSVDDIMMALRPPQQTQPPLFDPEQIYQTEDLIGNTSQYWDGCYSIDQRWGGTTGGSCPTINDQYDGQINYGYVNRTLVNTAAIDQALKGVGLETTGYTYSWRVKNADANRTHTGNGRAQADPFEVTVKIYDENGNSIYEKSYDYSYWMDWTSFSGSEEFDEPFNLDEISELQLSVTGYDIGYWAGYYGPEFADPNIKLNYRVAQGDTEDTTAQLLFEQQCMSDPTSDPTCLGYNDALIEQIASTTVVDDGTGTDDGTGIDSTTGLATTSTNSNTSGMSNDGTGFDDGTGVSNDGTVATTSSTGLGTDTNDGVPDPTGIPGPTSVETTDTGTTQVAGTPDATGNVEVVATPDPVQEAAEEIINDPIEETTAEATAPAATTTATTSTNAPRRGTGLNSTQLAALEAADAASANSESVAGESSTASAGIGLSASGGVSNSLTSVDPTSSTSALGGIGSTSSSNSSDVFGQNTTTSNGSDSGSDNGDVSSSSANGSTLAGDMSNEIGTGTFEEESSPEQQLAQIQDSAMESNDLPQFDLISDIINQVAQAAITQAVQDAEEVVEESIEESIEDQNAQEDALVAAAQAGSDDEDAQAALLGYNPNFRAYQQPQMQDGTMYNDQGVYLDQKTYDNPRAGLFNGASDATHRAMVRSQYEK